MKRLIYPWIFFLGCLMGASLGQMIMCFANGEIDWGLTFTVTTTTLFVLIITTGRNKSNDE